LALSRKFFLQSGNDAYAGAKIPRIAAKFGRHACASAEAVQ
jgi:hypothetical protein